VAWEREGGHVGRAWCGGPMALGRSERNSVIFYLFKSIQMSLF
jgi:hypothetical protein